MSHMQYFLFHRLLRLKLNTYLIVPVVVVVVVINIIIIIIIIISKLTDCYL